MKLSTFDNTRNPSIRTRVYEFLKEEISNLTLKPGLAISENETAERLQVSRTPVREAFLRLSQEDLVTVYPQKGSFVSLIDLDHLEESRFMREQLEVATAKLACEMLSEEYLLELEKNLELQNKCIANKNYNEFYNLDDAFHSIVFEGCNKSRIWSVMNNMMKINFNRVRLLSLSEKLNIDLLISQHHEIVESIRSKDTERAEKVVRAHLSLITIDREELMKKYPDYFM
ncbi:GntR family transcriptional regulator [Anaerobacillus sp. MEB173]|uniref:GntR family transcriptional regulator n=1 Tax=Anaerobacillus sp. MEB173 TaxID=3383345 RepID=UPI003F93A820